MLSIILEELKTYLSYNQENGLFTWIKKPALKNRANIGDIAGCVRKDGYVLIRLKNKLYLAHRLAWLYVFNEMPKYQIDHINGMKGDNRIINLRECNDMQNSQNIKKSKSNSKSELLGAQWNSAKNKWRSRININGKTLYLGYFDSAELASAAYIEAKRKYHEFNTI